MSFGSLSANAIRALNKGAAMGGDMKAIMVDFHDKRSILRLQADDQRGHCDDCSRSATPHQNEFPTVSTAVA